MKTISTREARKAGLSIVRTPNQQLRDGKPRQSQAMAYLLALLRESRLQGCR